MMYGKMLQNLMGCNFSTSFNILVNTIFGKSYLHNNFVNNLNLSNIWKIKQQKFSMNPKLHSI